MTCLTCAHWNLKDTPDKWQRLGFAKCNKELPPFKLARFHGPIDSCGKHAPAHAASIRKRKEFLK